MIINSKLTTGLAWTGLAVVLAVPAADFLTNGLGKGTQQAAVLTSTTDPVKTGSIDKSAAADPVDSVVASGKPLPDYISDSDSSAKTVSTKTVSTKAGAPAVTVSSGKTSISVAPVPAPADTTTVAIAEPAPVTPPVPFPARPAVIDEAPIEPAASPSVATAEPNVPVAPVVTATPRAATPPTTVVAPAPVAVAPAPVAVAAPVVEMPTPAIVTPAPRVATPAPAVPRVANADSDLVIVDDNGVASTRTVPAPARVEADPIVSTKTASVSGAKPASRDSMVDDSANWQNQTLRQYLTKRGILEDAGSESTATVTESDEYGDSEDDARYQARRASIEELLNQQNGDEDQGFSLF